MKNKIQEKEKIKTETTVNDLDKSYDSGKDIEGSRKIMSYNICNTC